MATRLQLISEARQWIGTRYQHQARTKGLATDCGGLVYGAGRAVGLLPPLDNPATYPQFQGYARLAKDDSLTKACNQFLERIESTEAQTGDVILMKFNNEPQHLAILGNYMYGGLSIIHAYAPARKVIETRFGNDMRSLVVGWYRYPGIES